MKYKKTEFLEDLRTLLNKYSIDNDDYDNVNEMFYVPITENTKVTECVNVYLSTYKVMKEL